MSDMQGRLRPRQGIKVRTSNKYLFDPNLVQDYVKDGTLTIQKNGSTVATFTANQEGDSTANLIIPTTPADIGALPDSTTIADLATTAQLAAVNSGATATKIGQITTNQNAIGNLSNLTTTAKTDLVSAVNEVDGTASTALQPNDNISSLTNDSGYITGITSGDVTTALGYTPADSASLATVATTGDYDDLTNKPTIPAAQVNSDWNANSGVAEILNKPTLGTMAAESASDYTKTSGLATVATTGDYDDLLDKPTIPTVNNATLTITQGGVSKGTFTANASSDVTIALDAGGTWGSITGTLSDQTDLANALSAKYDASNPNGYTSNVGTVTSVNNALPDANGNVTVSVGGVAWGAIGGTLSDQTDLQNALNAKANDSNVVKTSGNQNIGGTKSFTSSPKTSLATSDSSAQYNDGYQITDSSLDTSTNPAYSKTYYYAVKDKNNRYSSYISSSYGTDGSSQTGIAARTRNTDNSGDVGNVISIKAYRDGTVSTFAPTPVATNNTTNSNIATVGWVNDSSKSTNVVHRTGNETIGGDKTFSNPVTFNQTTTFTTGITKLFNGGYRMVQYKMATGNNYEDITFFDDASTFLGSIRVDNTGKFNLLSFNQTTTVTPTENTTSSTQIDTVGARNTALQGYANTSLSNLSSDGQMVVDSQNGTISNCILEIPQNLKLELSGNTLTAKSGSILTDSGSTYQTITLTSDKTLSISTTGSDRKLVIVATTSGTLGSVVLTDCSSGSTDSLAGTAYHIWFDTNNKEVNYYSSDGTTASHRTYPLCIIDIVNNVATFAKDSEGRDMIFNDIGFIGHHIFRLPNRKELVPDGFNTDGSLKSGLITANAVRISEMSAGGVYTGIKRAIASTSLWGGYIEVENYEDADFSKNWLRYYIKNENNTYVYNGTQIIRVNNEVCEGWFYYDGTTVTDFTIRQPVRTATTEMLENMQTTTNLVTSVSSSSTDSQYPSAKLLYDTASAKANDSAVVKLSGDQTIADIKTFTSSPVVPTPATSDNSTKAATTAFVNDWITANTATAHVVVESWTSGYSYYRVYSDGWIEQGGVKTMSSANTFEDVPLYKNYANANYQIMAVVSGTSTSTANVKVGDYSINSTSSFKLLASSANAVVRWRCEGQG